MRKQRSVCRINQLFVALCRSGDLCARVSFVSPLPGGEQCNTRCVGGLEQADSVKFVFVVLFGIELADNRRGVREAAFIEQRLVTRLVGRLRKKVYGSWKVAQVDLQWAISGIAGGIGAAHATVRQAPRPSARRRPQVPWNSPALTQKWPLVNRAGQGERN